ncbi:hypothetical protein A2T98_18115 [Nodularia spumigena CENA596]|uniref:Uncharacterized protein n=1 Tax=Nodularia spumigena CENA596 TaxID=1819295 RepID=A0A161XIZ4_NODSP|nr:hypothetical protein [Microcystis aeruginosa]KZL48414.1 hypothetical protein A2T98_18115 [Nodularia spumigena CENA596]MDB9400715.1 hypothetical protein [Microcystis aeruginosa CS-567/02-A1]
MGLGILQDGKWISRRDQEDSQGKFIRPSTTYRDQVTADGSSGFKAEPGRYHLYISWACPIDFDAPHNRDEVVKK